MRTPHDVVLDPFTYYSYKGTWKDHDPTTEPSWTGEHARRLQAYRVLEHYYRNASRWWVDSTDKDVQDSRREYGDAALLVNQVMASVLGMGGLKLHVEGAELEPVLQPAEPAEGTGANDPTTANGAIPTAASEIPSPTEILDAGTADTPPPLSGPDLQLKKLREWMTKDRFYTKMMEHERTTGKLGDGVLVLGWSEKKNRPVMNVYDPGFYFPVYEGDNADDEGFNQDYPNKVHIAYEYEDESEDPGKERKVRRITWELDTYEDGEVGQLLPWNTGPAEATCWYTDAWWYASNDQDLTDLDPKDAHYTIKDQDLEIDFIPVVHFTNTVAGNEIWGQSTIATVMQILDDLVSSDTDLQAASATTGTPPLSVKGTVVGTDQITSYGPGTVLSSENGVDMVDTSRSLDALTNYVKHLLERLSINSRVPESMLGRVKPSEVPSGIALWLSFAPHSTMIEEMRMVRQEKYSLLFKFITRFYMLAGELENSYPCSVTFGPYLPADKSETLNMVTNALNANTPPISLATGIKMLMDAGWPIESIASELAAIQARDFSGASELVGATGNSLDAYLYLGMEPTPMPIEPGMEEGTGTGAPGEETGLDDPLDLSGNGTGATIF